MENAESAEIYPIKFLYRVQGFVFGLRYKNCKLKCNFVNIKTILSGGYN